ILWEK
ncbi:hypothetical protein SOVF_049580, partial [Spinacia oleracea]